jgi:hypothetical protein
VLVEQGGAGDREPAATPRARGLFRLAEFGVQHEQHAEVIGVLGWPDAERAPEPGDPVQPLAAQLALRSRVDRGERRQPQHQRRRVVGVALLGQP